MKTVPSLKSMSSNPARLIDAAHNQGVFSSIEDLQKIAREHLQEGDTHLKRMEEFARVFFNREVALLGATNLNGAQKPQLGPFERVSFAEIYQARQWVKDVNLLKFARVLARDIPALNPILNNDRPLNQKAEAIREFLNNPQNTASLQNITLLYLAEKNLTQLSPEIDKLVNLQYLHLNLNRLTQLPTEIGNLRNLKLLWLDYNQLTQLPAEIGNLVNLQGLWLQYNQLRKLPFEIGNLENLSSLTLFFNHLQFQPELFNTPSENIRRAYSVIFPQASAEPPAEIPTPQTFLKRNKYLIAAVTVATLAIGLQLATSWMQAEQKD